jgi:hypothetical protein
MSGILYRENLKGRKREKKEIFHAFHLSCFYDWFFYLPNSDDAATSQISKKLGNGDFRFSKRYTMRIGK